MSPGKFAVAATAVACMTLVSFNWSEQRGVSLSIESAQAQVKHHPQTSASAAAVSRRHYRRTAHGYGPAAVGAGLAAGAIGTAAGVTAAATSPWGYPGGGPYASTGGGEGYYAVSAWGEYDCRAPHAYECRPYGSKDWSK
ncbi:MAG TPA: hypothetical protein VG099_16895 [Gemmataceae bacterium]|nr:hypothetical protein [Gemmataceae bacterium]